MASLQRAASVAILTTAILAATLLIGIQIGKVTVHRLDFTGHRIGTKDAAFDSHEVRPCDQASLVCKSESLLTGITLFQIAIVGVVGLGFFFLRGIGRPVGRKRQEEPSENEERLRLLVRGVSDYAIFMLDPDGLVVTWNEGAQRIAGYSAEEIVGCHFSKFYPPEAMEQGQPARELEIARKHGRYEEEGCRVRKDGSRYWASVLVTVVRDQTDQIRGFAKVTWELNNLLEAEEAVLTADALKRAIFNSANFSQIATDAEGVIQIFNVGAERMLGYEAAEVINHLTPADISDAGELVARAEALSTELHTLISPGFDAMVYKASRGIEDAYELTYVRKDGSRFPAMVSVTALRDACDRVIGYLLIGTDNTARKQAEERRNRAEQERQATEAALRNSEDFLDRTGRLAAVGGWRLDLTSGAVIWSAETARLHGVDPAHKPTYEEALNFFIPRARQIVRAAVEKSIVDGQPWELEVPLMRADGRRIWARIVASVELAEGKPVRLVGAFQDVTARVAEQRSLREANTRAMLATESGGIGIWEWDIKARTFKWDPGVYRLYGRVPHSGQTESYESWRDQLHPEDRHAAELALSECLKGNKAYSTVFRVIWPDGSVHHLRAVGQVDRDEAGLVVRMIGTNVDITALVEADETSRRAMKIAEESNQIKSDFLANMSHEVRTPMNAILGLTHLALRAHPTPQQMGYLTKISNAAHSLLGIMNDILDFSKIEAGKLEMENITFLLSDVWKNVIDIVGQKADQKHLAIVLSVDPETPRCLTGDPLRLGQVLINLVNNAIKFSETGEIVVRVTAEQLTFDHARLSFSVNDEGIGMSPEQVTNLFQSFNQGDSSFTRKYGGTGLGLAISKQICELMGGSISVQSQLGKGSTFLFTAEFGISRSELPLAGLEPRINSQQKSVLVVDDSENTCSVLLAMLNANNFRGRAVSSGEEALSALISASQEGQPYDLVVMDWRLPGIDGMEASRRIRSHLEFSNVPSILMVSAFDREEVGEGQRGVILDGFLIKPFSEASLIASISTILLDRAGEITVKSQAAPTMAAGELAGRKVLLVEDNEINRELAMELLADLGISVTVAVNGREGVDRNAQEAFDLVLMDIQMPVMDGLSATKLIRSDERFRTLPIIAMTAHAMSGDRERSLSAGMSDHLTKPIDFDTLTQALLRWVPATSAAKQVAVMVPLKPSTVTVRLQPFDMQRALVRMNGKPALLRKIMAGFLDQYSTAVCDLRLDIAETRVREAERRAHSLKSVAGMLEAKDLAEAASSVEQALRFDRIDAAVELIETLDRELAPAVIAAETWLSASSDR